MKKLILRKKVKRYVLVKKSNKEKEPTPEEALKSAQRNVERIYKSLGLTSSYPESKWFTGNIWTMEGFAHAIGFMTKDGECDPAFIKRYPGLKRVYEFVEQFGSGSIQDDANNSGTNLIDIPINSPKEYTEALLRVKAISEALNWKLILIPIPNRKKDDYIAALKGNNQYKENYYAYKPFQFYQM